MGSAITLDRIRVSSMVYRIFCYQFNTCFGSEYLYYKNGIVISDDENKLYFDLYFSDFFRTIRRTKGRIYKSDVRKLLRMFASEKWNSNVVKIEIVNLMFENFIDVQRFYSMKNIEILKTNFFVFDPAKHTIAMRGTFDIDEGEILDEYENRILSAICAIQNLFGDNILCNDVRRILFDKLVNVYLKCEIRLN